MPSWIFVAFATTALTAADGRKPATAMLVSFDQLQQKLDAPTLRLLDCRPRADYDRGHIPGAVWIDARAIEKLAARPGALADPKPWEAWISSLGIGQESEIYVYDASRQLDAARIWWLLRYCGVGKVGLIDGGFPLWAKQKRPVRTIESPVAPRPFKVEFQRRRLADRDDVLKLLADKSARVVDARSEAEHTGEARKSKRGGRLPGSCHLEWKDLVDADGRFLSRDALGKKFEQSGLAARDSVVTHCQGGGRSSVNAFALELLGFDARNYYLGWSDWGNVDGGPIESGPKPPK